MTNIPSELVYWCALVLYLGLLHAVQAHTIPHHNPNGEQIFIQNDNVTIQYTKHGSGPYMVFQHGFPDNEKTFNAFQVPLFSASYTVLTPTLRGYPPSSIPPQVADYAPEHFTSDLLAILDHENATTAILVGHDIGGAIVQYFALDHSSRVEALVLINTPIIPVFLPLIEFDESVQAYAEYTIPYYAYEKGQPKNVSTLVAPIRNETYRAEIAEYLEGSPIDGMLHFYNENYPEPPYHQNISVDGFVQTVPSLLLWGEEDVYFSPKLLDRLEGWFGKGLRLVTVPGAGHWVFRDRWKRVNEEIWSFLGVVGEIEVGG